MRATDKPYVPEDLLYTREHEWAKIEPDGTVVVGVTDYAQRKLHEVVFVGLPELGSKVKQGSLLGTVESVKAVSEVFSPVAGEVVEVNNALANSPELINKDPYGKGWIARIRPNNLQIDVHQLLTAQQYSALQYGESR
ncbi:MAG: glycine cleavage system protein GcvH [Candidatus Bathyarchaeia archaeon]